MPNDDDYETIRNEERGCGFLDHGKAYLRSPPRGEDGVLPPFVEFDPPIPYLERSKFRGYEYFPGLPFELSVTGTQDYPRTEENWTLPAEPEPETWDVDLPFDEEKGIYSTDPPGEVWRHIARLTGSATGGHAGDMVSFAAHDLYQHVGASYYETPEEFITEVEEQGLSKAIPVSQSQEPPVVNPGRTRLFLVHPNAAGEENDTPGVIGYVYLSRTVYTEDTEGRFPAWAKKQSKAREDLDLVRVGDQIYEDGTRATTVDEVDDIAEGEEVVTHSNIEDEDDLDEQAADAMDAAADALGSTAETVGPSDKEGRDVEAVADSTSDGEISDVEIYDHALDEEEIREQLDDAADEIAEFEKNHVRLGEDVWIEARYVEVSTPEDCPECGEATEEETMEGGGVVTFCPTCGWDNASEVNAALVENGLRDEDYNDLRSRASDELKTTPPGNPSYEDLIRAFLDEWGLIDG